MNQYLDFDNPYSLQALGRLKCDFDNPYSLQAERYKKEEKEFDRSGIYMNYTEYMVEKEKVMAQWKLLEEMIELARYTDMDCKEVIEYELKKVWDKVERLRPLEERYNKR